MWIDPIQGSTVFLDTAPVIYFVEESPSYSEIVSPFFHAASSGTIQAITSVVTLSEVLVVPLRNGSDALAGRYRQFLSPAGGVELYLITQQIAEEAALIRATYRRIRMPDALQMATALVVGARYFLTNDKALPDVPNLHMLVLDNLAQI